MFTIFSTIAGTIVVTIVVVVALFYFAKFSGHNVRIFEAHQTEIKNLKDNYLRQIIEAQEEVRQNLAARLHDEVGPFLSSSKMNLQIMSSKAATNQIKSEDFRNEIENYDGIIKKVRMISHEMSPQMIDKTGLMGSVSKFLDINKSVQTNLIDLTEGYEFENKFQLSVFRIVLELLNNQYKYDTPTHMDVTFKISNNMFEFTLDHDGQGISHEEFENFMSNSKGMGILNINTNLIVIKGILKFSKKPSEHKVKLTAPLK